MMQVRLDLELIGVILYETWMIHGGMMKKIEIELIIFQIWTSLKFQHFKSTKHTFYWLMWCVKFVQLFG